MPEIYKRIMGQKIRCRSHSSTISIHVASNLKKKKREKRKTYSNLICVLLASAQNSDVKRFMDVNVTHYVLWMPVETVNYVLSPIFRLVSISSPGLVSSTIRRGVFKNFIRFLTFRMRMWLLRFNLFSLILFSFFSFE